MEHCDLVIVAGGSSTRFGHELPKQFEIVNDRPLLFWSLEAFLAWSSIGNVIVVVPDAWVEPVKKSLEEVVKFQEIQVVAGGASRQESASKGLVALHGVSQAEWVMVHDAARPAITGELIERIWEARNHGHGVIPGIRVTETIKVVSVNGLAKVVETPNRSSLFVAQTPQLFKRLDLFQAYDENKGLEAVDDASLIEKRGLEVIVVEGDVDNIKVTFSEDMNRVSHWLRDRYPPL